MNAEPASSQAFRLLDRILTNLPQFLRRSFQPYRTMAYTAWFDHSSQHQPGLFDKVRVYSGDQGYNVEKAPHRLISPGGFTSEPDHILPLFTFLSQNLLTSLWFHHAIDSSLRYQSRLSIRYTSRIPSFSVSRSQQWSRPTREASRYIGDSNCYRRRLSSCGRPIRRVNS